MFGYTVVIDFFNKEGCLRTRHTEADTLDEATAIAKDEARTAFNAVIYSLDSGRRIMEVPGISFADWKMAHPLPTRRARR